MERQRSFSLKHTRFLAFTFAASSSLIFLFLLFFIKSSILNQQEARFTFEFLSSHSDSSKRDRNGSYSVHVFNDSIHFRLHSIQPGNLSRFAKIQVISKYGAKDNGSLFADRWKKNVVVSCIRKEERKIAGGCDISKGRWVFDDSYPVYTNSTCPFIDEAFDCMSNGRLSLGYMKWRWQPGDCDLPRFNATGMLNLLRGKRLVFVGDSINRNQWESLLCLLIGAVEDPRRVLEMRGRRITKGRGNYSFRFLDYKCTVEYYVTHFLVHESKARIGRRRVPTLRIDTMDRGTSRWRGADVLVFNTAHWWSHYKTQSGNNYYQEGSMLHPHLDVLTAFRRAMMTWASWVDKNINPRKTRVFFRSSAPTHFRGGQWNSGGHCREATQPDNARNFTYPEKSAIVEDVIKQMKTPITVLNITSLSEYRIDGHPSIYGTRSRDLHRSIEDCSHWCLPGVPDTWNHLLYLHLQSFDRH